MESTSLATLVTFMVFYTPEPYERNRQLRSTYARSHETNNPKETRIM